MIANNRFSVNKTFLEKIKTIDYILVTVILLKKNLELFLLQNGNLKT